jgi:GTP cyclohydrolase IA
MTTSDAGGLFPLDGAPIKHHCARCGTGYAGPECDPPAKVVDQMQKELIVSRLLADVIGEDITRGGLKETPQRVVAAWEEWTSGYHVNIKELFKTFEDGAKNYDEMVVRKDIRIYSHCEHHLAPIIGTCTVAYIPSGKIVGLSKLDRLVDAFARRLQVQERLTAQIADAIWEHLEPLGVGVHINAKHMCIESRGVRQHASDTITCALRGAMREQPAARAEFLSLTNN